ncbi:MAG: YfhO family protein, partial [bacterium]|nr:YfhO family protein [bacterium]
YGYCGLTLSNANLLVRLLGTPYLPLMLLFWHLTIREGRRRWFVLTLACGLLQVLTGAVEMVVIGFLTVLGWGIFDAEARLSLRRRLGLWWLLCLAVAGLAAVQLAPMIELVSQSMRGEGMSLATFGSWSLDPRRLPELLVPGFLGRTDTLAGEDFWGGRLVTGDFPYLLSIYLGAIPLVLAMVGGSRRSRHLPRGLRGFLVVLLVLAVVLSMGRFLPLFELVYKLPLITLFRFPIKLLSIAVLPLALLSAIGAELVFSDVPDDRRHARGVLAAAGTVLGAAAAYVLVAMVVPDLGRSVQRFFFEQATPRAAQGLRAALSQVLGFWLLAALVLLMMRLRPRSWQPWVLAAIVVSDLMIGGRRVNPTVSAEILTATPQAAQRVDAEAAGGRLYRTRHPTQFQLDPPSNDIVWLYRWNQEVLNFYLGASYRIPVIFHDDFHGLAPRRVVNLKEGLDLLPWERRLPILSAASVRVLVTKDELAISGVERVGVIQNASGIPFFVYRNTHAAERVELIEVWYSVDSESDAVAAMLAPGFDPRQHAVLEGAVPAQPGSACEPNERVEIMAESHYERRLAVSTACPGVLVFSEVFYPGWEAVIDGETAPILRANAAFSAVMIEPGEHEVIWRYVPRTLYLGLAITGLTLVVLLGGLPR